MASCDQRTDSPNDGEDKTSRRACDCRRPSVDCRGKERYRAMGFCPTMASDNAEEKTSWTDEPILIRKAKTFDGLQRADLIFKLVLRFGTLGYPAIFSAAVGSTAGDRLSACCAGNCDPSASTPPCLPAGHDSAVVIPQVYRSDVLRAVPVAAPSSIA
jgi:hypothetical protein